VTSNEIEQVYRRFGASVHRRCRAILRDEAMAEDAVHEVFVRLMRYNADLTDPVAALAWLNRVGERCCFDLLKKHKSRETTSPLPSIEDSPCSDQLDKRLAARDIVMRFWQRLGRRQRAVAVGYYVDGLSQDELARRLRRTRRTIYTDLKRIEAAAGRFRATVGSV
jgi:RNA polymerase sigma factor (sigma-70 family)